VRLLSKEYRTCGHSSSSREAGEWLDMGKIQCVRQVQHVKPAEDQQQQCRANCQQSREESALGASEH
jgi:hypothetical protein